MTVTDSRAAAFAAGKLPTFRGEERQQEFRAEIRGTTAAKNGKDCFVLDGYASTVEQGYTMYDMFGAYTEIIDRGAFDATLSAAPEVNFLVNHTGLSMARTGAGTLDLSADDQGLRSLAYLNPLRGDVHDLQLAVQDGALREMSFAFRIEEGQWSPDYSEYRITKVNLDRGDVSAVNFGANPYTSISARAKQGLDAIEHLEGEPLRMLAARAQARLVEAGVPLSKETLSVIDSGIGAPDAVHIAKEVMKRADAARAKRRPNIRTLRARLEMEERD